MIEYKRQVECRIYFSQADDDSNLWDPIQNKWHPIENCVRRCECMDLPGRCCVRQWIAQRSGVAPDPVCRLLERRSALKAATKPTPRITTAIEAGCVSHADGHHNFGHP